MAVEASDIGMYLSVPSATAGFTDAQGSPNASLGGFISTTELSDTPLHNLFDVITGDENAAEDVEYRCVFVRNANATDTLYAAVLWISAEVSDGADAAIGLDPAGITDEDAGTAQAAIIATEQDTPAGVSFSAPTSKGAGLAIGDLGPGRVSAIWVRRTATDSVAVDADGVTLRVEGDTGA